MFVPIIAAAAAATIAVPAGVAIPATMVSSVSSRTAKVGDAFVFRTTQSVRAGSVTIPAGSIGHGVVSAVTRAAGTKRGSLALLPQTLDVAPGASAPGAPGRIFVAAPDTGGLQHRARRHFFPFPIPVPGAFVVGALVNPGGDVTVGPGTAFTVVTAAPPG